MKFSATSASSSSTRTAADDESGMADIEAEIVANPTHPMIRALKGARKARIQRPGMGKRGGGRVIYYVALGTDRFYYGSLR